MITPAQESKRKKVNFMINMQIVSDLNKWIPAGERSDFVNETLQGAITRYKRELAAKLMDELRAKANIHFSTKELIRLKNYGRK